MRHELVQTRRVVAGKIDDPALGWAPRQAAEPALVFVARQLEREPVDALA
jgi:hypothetical protein